MPQRRKNRKIIFLAASRVRSASFKMYERRSACRAMVLTPPRPSRSPDASVTSERVCVAYCAHPQVVRTLPLASFASELAYIDTLENSKIRRDSVKRMTKIQDTSQSLAETKYFRVAAREHNIAPPGRHRPRHSRTSLMASQSTPAIDAAIYRPNGTLYQLQPSFHTHSTEPEPTARARRAGKEFY